LEEPTFHRARLYGLVAAVAVSGAAMTLEPREPWLGIAPPRTLLLVVTAAVVACKPVRISRLRIELVAFHPFVLMAFGLSGIRAAVIVALAGLLAAALSRKPKPAWYRLLFNLGAITFATVTAGMVFVGIGGKPGAAAAVLVWPLAAAALTFFLASTGLVAAAISLEMHQGYLVTWKRSLLWTIWSNVAGASIAVAGLALFGPSPLAAIVVSTAPCWLLVLFYRAEAARPDGSCAAVAS
jgi:hypothetical protein